MKKVILQFLVGGGIAAGWAAAFAPAWLVFPNSEVENLSYYLDAERVFNKTETNPYRDDGVSYVVTGACPDLSLETAKALADKKLTNREVYDLRKKAKALHETSLTISVKNEALIAAGQKPIPNPIQCSDGNELFKE